MENTAELVGRVAPARSPAMISTLVARFTMSALRKKVPVSDKKNSMKLDFDRVALEICLGRTFFLM